MRKRLLTAALLSACVSASAAEMSGVTLPETQDADGAHLVLNGMALRTVSFLHLHVYVAGLYLEHRSSDPDAILQSSGPKLLRFTFLRDIGQFQIRHAWRESLAQSCTAPCQLPPQTVEAFIAHVPAVHSGDTSVFAFTSHGLEVAVNGHVLGRVEDPHFVHVLLLTFIGPHPTTPEVKRALLGLKA